MKCAQGSSRRGVARVAVGLVVSLAAAGFSEVAPVRAAAALTVTPITWDVIGLDSNKVTSGPNVFPVGQRVCNTGDTATGSVTATFAWENSTNSTYIYLQAGTLTTVTLGTIAAGSCKDAYYNVEIKRDAASYNKTRRYTVTATDGSVSATSPTPRQIYVEYLVSQNRNATLSIDLNGVVIPGGTVRDLIVGGTYTITLNAATTTQGYEQLETFLGMPNSAFQIQAVTTSYSANTSPLITDIAPETPETPASLLSNTFYANSCGWDPDPSSPNYRTCVGGAYKTGGNTIITTYTVKIIGGSGIYTLYPMLYDFSGSSFHYNSDYASAARQVRIVEPVFPTFSKSFNPNPIAVGQISTLTFTITNPNSSTISGVNFVDNLSAGLTVAATPAVTYSAGCTSGTLTAVAGATQVSFANGSIAPNASCLITVDLIASSATAYPNTTTTLKINGTTDTNRTASDTLLVTGSSGSCSTTSTDLATWSFTTPGSLTKSSGVSTATAAPKTTGQSSVASGVWKTWGYGSDSQYVEFQIVGATTPTYSGVLLSFKLAKGSSGPSTFVLQYFDGTTWNTVSGTSINPGSNTINLTSILGAPTLQLRLSGTGTSNNTESQGFITLDDVSFTGCDTAISGGAPTPPSATFTKAFSPDPIKVGATSTLTFTIVNTGGPASGVSFDDRFPDGITVASSPNTSVIGCTGTMTAVAGASSVAFSGGSIADGSGTPQTCTVTVDVVGTASGTWSNQTDFLKIGGSAVNLRASDTIGVIAPPVLSKAFNPAVILPSGSTGTPKESTLSFTITNPNASGLTGLTFTDPLPPGITVVGTPTASQCGGTVGTSTAGSPAVTTVSFTGGTLTAGTSCTVSVTVTGSTEGEYTNTTSEITSTEANPGNATTALLVIQDKKSALDLTKQVYVSSTNTPAPTDSSTWLKTRTWTGTSGYVWYRFVVTNSGETQITGVAVSDPGLPAGLLSGCPPVTTLEPGEETICIVGPVAWDGQNPVTNTASASGTSGGAITSQNATTRAASAQITLSKRSLQSNFSRVGQQLTYQYKVENTGSAALRGPVTIADSRIANVTCPSVSTAQTGPESNPSAGSGGNYLMPGEWVICSGTDTVQSTDRSSITNYATATLANVNDPKSSTQQAITLWRWDSSNWENYDPLANVTLPDTGSNTSSMLGIAALLLVLGSLCIGALRRGTVG